MGWIPLAPIIVSVRLGGSQPPRPCRLLDQRNYEALVEFVHRTHALAQAKEYSFVIEACTKESSHSLFHFTCAGPNATILTINSSPSLAHALRTSPVASYVNGILLLTMIEDVPQRAPDARVGGNVMMRPQADHFQYMPAVLPRPIAELADVPRTNPLQLLAELEVLPAAGVRVPNSRSGPTRYYELERNFRSGSTTIGTNYERPATMGNIGQRSHLHNVDVHDRPSASEATLPEEKITRAWDNLSLKNYGHGMNSRQVCQREKQMT